MSEHVPTLEEIFEATVSVTADKEFRRQALVAFDSRIAEVERAAAQKAWDAAWTEVSMIPHWWNTEEQRGGFDIQPTGTGAALEEGAFMEVRRVLRDNPYRRNEGENND